MSHSRKRRHRHSVPNPYIADRNCGCRYFTSGWIQLAEGVERCPCWNKHYGKIDSRKMLPSVRDQKAAAAGE